MLCTIIPKHFHKKLGLKIRSSGLTLIILTDQDAAHLKALLEKSVLCKDMDKKPVFTKNNPLA